MSIKIITDSTWDFDEEQRKEYDAEVVPLYIKINGKTYKEGVDIKNEEFYEIMNKSNKNPVTSQPTPYDFVEVYKKYLKDFDYIISIHISSNLSGTYNSAVLAKKEVDKKDRIYVIDSLTASGALGLMVYFAAKLIKENKNLLDIVDYLEKLKNKIFSIFILDNLKTLESGGRIGKAQYLLGSILNFKPVLSLRNGIIEPCGSGKILGSKNVVQTILKYLKTNYNNGPFTGGIAHNIIKEIYFKKIDLLSEEVKNITRSESIFITKFGSTITSHIGLNCIGLSFVEEI